MGKPIAPGQVPAFFEESEEVYIAPGVTRHDVAWRAGTTLDHKWTHKVVGTGKQGSRVHGLYDERQRIYQTGGEISNFVYWKSRWITFARDAWDQVWQKTDWFEVIDHEKNVCWRISGQKARKNAKTYTNSIGPRIGIPMELWDVIRADSTYEKRGGST